MTAETDTFELLPDRRWHVARTKPRCEKKLAEYCEKRSITCYLPLRRSIRRYTNRVVEFMVPLFTGYVFVQTNEPEKTIVVESRHAAHLITPDALMEESLVRELNDILLLERATQMGELIVRPEIEVGKIVQIHSGPLAGLHGIVTRRKNKARLTVNVELVGQSVSIETDVSDVELEY